MKYQEEKPWEDNMQANRQLWQEKVLNTTYSVGPKGWLAIAKLKPLSLFFYLILMVNKAFDNVKIEK